MLCVVWSPYKSVYISSLTPLRIVRLVWGFFSPHFLGQKLCSDTSSLHFQQGGGAGTLSPSVSRWPCLPVCSGWMFILQAMPGWGTHLNSQSPHQQGETNPAATAAGFTIIIPSNLLCCWLSLFETSYCIFACKCNWRQIFLNLTF